MVFATPEQMALFDADQIVNPQMGGAEDADRIVSVPGYTGPYSTLVEMKAAGEKWLLAGGARRRSIKRRGRRSTKGNRCRSMKKKTRRRGSRQ